MPDRLRTAALVAWLLLPACDAGPEEVAPPEPVAESSVPAVPAEEPVLPRIEALDGVSSQGAFDTDGSGRFVPGKASVELFEYYLTLAKHEPVEDVRLHIEAAIRKELAEPEPALVLLDQYLPYREELRALELDALALEDRLATIRALRESHFGKELADELFAAEEARARFEIEWQRIADDPSLTDEEREKRLEQLEQQLPGPVRLRRKLARVALRVEREEAELRAAGASEEEIRALREERFGATAAERVEQLRASRAEWDARVARYRDARVALLDEMADADSEEREGALSALLEEHFEPREQERVLDQLATEAGPDAPDPSP